MTLWAGSGDEYAYNDTLMRVSVLTSICLRPHLPLTVKLTVKLVLHLEDP